MVLVTETMKESLCATLFNKIWAVSPPIERITFLPCDWTVWIWALSKDRLTSGVKSGVANAIAIIPYCVGTSSSWIYGFVGAFQLFTYPIRTGVWICPNVFITNIVAKNIKKIFFVLILPVFLFLVSIREKYYIYLLTKVKCSFWIKVYFYYIEIEREKNIFGCRKLAGLEI